MKNAKQPGNSKRRALSGAKSRSLFSKTASYTHRLNTRAAPMRGGIRL